MNRNMCLFSKSAFLTTVTAIAMIVALAAPASAAADKEQQVPAEEERLPQVLLEAGAFRRGPCRCSERISVHQ